MNKQLVFKLAALLIVCCAMLSCGKETTVYGTVVYSSGDPVPNLKVSLEYGDFYHGYTPVYSAITGSDGQYEIIFNYDYDDERTYWIHLGQVSYDWSYHKVNIIRGQMNRFDIVY